MSRPVQGLAAWLRASDGQPGMTGGTPGVQHGTEALSGSMAQYIEAMETGAPLEGESWLDREEHITWVRMNQARRVSTGVPTLTERADRLKLAYRREHGERWRCISITAFRGVREVACWWVRPLERDGYPLGSPPWARAVAELYQPWSEAP